MSRRFLTICKGCVFALIVALGLANLIQFPDEPLAPCHGPGGYCGKQGQPHTAADYNRYQDWATVQIIVIAIGAIGLIIIGWRKPKI